ncbi:MAG: Nif3-like dinuclear metal center hexameric protein [Gemmatimonadota bacterium]|nr:Nif3-like dinuclear metal center hexameric protein [Gemmatimonadota bacterium]
MADLREIVEHMDAYLDVGAIPDAPGARNGLQVDGRSPVERICAAVDASQETIDAAAAEGAQLLLVHHGLFWGDPLPVVGRTYRRLKALFDADLAVYSCHLPLDVHPEIGNNVLLARALGLEVEGRFGAWAGYEGVGVWCAADLPLDALAGRVTDACGSDPRVIGGGPGHVRRLGIVTGGAGSMISMAHEAGLDTFLTGEGNHHTYHDATELGVNVLYAGHYATETPGVKALGERVASRFDVAWSFIDRPTGL